MYLLPVAESAGPEKESFRTFISEKFEFRCDLPDTWDYRITEDEDIMFYGPPGTEAGATRIVVQIIERAPTDRSTALDQLRSMWEQIAGIKGSRLETDGTAPVAGQEAPFFIARYPDRSTLGVEQTRGHIQVVLEKPQYFFLLSFEGPDAAFDDHLKVFKHMNATFQFGATPATGSPAQTTESKAVAGTGEGRYPVEGYGFSVVLPEGWTSEREDKEDSVWVYLRDPGRQANLIVFAGAARDGLSVEQLVASWEERAIGELAFMSKPLAGVDWHPLPGGDSGILVKHYEGQVDGSAVHTTAGYHVSGGYGVVLMGLALASSTDPESFTRGLATSLRLAPREPSDTFSAPADNGEELEDLFAD